MYHTTHFSADADTKWKFSEEGELLVLKIGSPDADSMVYIYLTVEKAKELVYGLLNKYNISPEEVLNGLEEYKRKQED